MFCLGIGALFLQLKASAHTFGALIETRFCLRVRRSPLLSWCNHDHAVMVYTNGAHAPNSLVLCEKLMANAFGGLIGAEVLGNLNGAHGIAGW